MDDYIKREAFLKTWCESYCRPKQNCRDDCSFYDAITQFPAADVQENVRGEWKQGTAILNRSICSVCGWWTDELSTATFNYCPICGADMRLRDKE